MKATRVVEPRVGNGVVEAAKEPSERHLGEVGESDRVVRGIEGGDHREARSPQAAEGREPDSAVPLQSRTRPSGLGDREVHRPDRDPEEPVALPAAVGRVLDTLLAQRAGADHDDDVVRRLFVARGQAVFHGYDRVPARLLGRADLEERLVLAGVASTRGQVSSLSSDV